MHALPACSRCFSHHLPSFSVFFSSLCLIVRERQAYEGPASSHHRTRSSGGLSRPFGDRSCRSTRPSRHCSGSLLHLCCFPLTLRCHVVQLSTCQACACQENEDDVHDACSSVCAHFQTIPYPKLHDRFFIPSSVSLSTTSPNYALFSVVSFSLSLWLKLVVCLNNYGEPEKRRGTFRNLSPLSSCTFPTS